MLIHVGLDDTDSPSGGCTTYIAALLVERLTGLGARFVDYPNLVRLNPNVPWKTRGNGAVCLRFEAEPEVEEPIKRFIVETIERHAYFECENTNPGIVFHVGEVPKSVRMFSRRVIQGVVALDDAKRLIEESGASAVGFKNMRGIIGALAAIGGCLDGDHTFEFLAYRTPENRGKPRRLDMDSITEMDKLTSGETFNNRDAESGRPLIAPHGPDPVLFGVRGESAEGVYRAGSMVRSEEPIERWVLFRTNHGTDAHLREVRSISELQPHNPAIVVGEVDRRPNTIVGGHVILPLKDGTGQVDCAAYEPTGHFRDVIRCLAPGDRVKAYGGVRAPGDTGQVTLNLEKLEVLQLAPEICYVNPRCPKCGGGMESMGRKQGFRCRRCGFRAQGLAKRAVESTRRIVRGLYIAPPRAQRHLTKPAVRYGREKNGCVLGELREPWHWP